MKKCESAIMTILFSGILLCGTAAGLHAYESTRVPDVPFVCQKERLD